MSALHEITGQHGDALRLANSIRSARARTRDALASMPYEHGLELLADTLETMPPEAVNWKAIDVVCCFHRVGRQRAVRMLRVSAIPENKALGTFTQRQQRVFIGDLRTMLLGGVRRAA